MGLAGRFDATGVAFGRDWPRVLIGHKANRIDGTG